MAKLLVKHRRSFQYFFGGITLYLFLAHPKGLLIILGVGILTGGILGKVFCKWMCPIGLMMEFMTKNMSSEQSKVQMYNYYKLGCPVAWIQGFLNKFSVFKIRRNKSTCTSCGICDKACYISSINPEMSLYKAEKSDSSTAYSCSKCLACVTACPNNSLEFKVK